jgi:cytochrome c5
MEISKRGTGRSTRSKSANGFDHSCDRFAKAQHEENHSNARRRHERFRQELAAGITTTDYAEPRLKRRKIMRTWQIAGIALAASNGAALAQDAAAGEQVFKRLCSPCHEIGPEAKIKLGPPLNGIDGRKAGTFEGFNYSPDRRVGVDPGTVQTYSRSMERAVSTLRSAV